MKGKTFITKRAIKQIAVLSAMRCYGVVGLSPVNLKESIQKILGWDEGKRGVEVFIDDRNIKIVFHVILLRNINVKEVVNNLITQTVYAFEKMTKLTPEVVVVVEGIKEG
ncbi:MAG: Asp23/Gls24 family envelope stress response protein [Caldisericia bacterium]|nr:Asp23/Gls24 family envelope stress response protein [Caldisericia bacterium]